MPDAATIISLIGALGLGSVVGQWVTTAKDRRSSRADALSALGRVETARWAPVQKEALSYQDASRALLTAALLARIPVSVVREYLVLAQAAAWLSQQSVEENPLDEFAAGAIESELAQIVRGHAHLLADVIWTPSPIRRLRYPGKLKKLRIRTDALETRSTQTAIDHSRRHGVA